MISIDIQTMMKNIATVACMMQVPLRYNDSNSSTRISLFVREVVALSKLGHKQPTLLFLQGKKTTLVPFPC